MSYAPITPIKNIFNQDRLNEQERNSSLVNFKATHLLDPSMFYELNFSLYNQERKRSVVWRFSLCASERRRHSSRTRRHRT